MQLSARNQIPATVTSINYGEAIANVELNASGSRLVSHHRRGRQAARPGGGQRGRGDY